MEHAGVRVYASFEMEGREAVIQERAIPEAEEYSFIPTAATKVEFSLVKAESRRQNIAQ